MLINAIQELVVPCGEGICLERLEHIVCFTASLHMMASSNEDIFRGYGPLWGEFTDHRWIPLTKASDAELWCFLWSAPESTVE